MEWHTSSLTRRAEHCNGTPIILCGFHVTELALRKTSPVKRWHHDKLRLLPCACATELRGFGHCFPDARKTLSLQKNQQIYIFFWPFLNSVSPSSDYQISQMCHFILASSSSLFPFLLESRVILLDCKWDTLQLQQQLSINLVSTHWRNTMLFHPY